MSCEVLVIGAGAAGSTFARCAAVAGRSTLLVDGPCAERPFLETLAANHGGGAPASGLVARCVERRGQWGDGDEAGWPALLNPHGADWFVDRSQFDLALRERAIAEGAVPVVGVARAPVRQANAWSVEVENLQVSAMFLIDATGRRGAVARRLGGRRRQFDRLVGVAAPRVGTDRRDTGVRIIAAPSGWWYGGPGVSGNLAMYFTDGDLSHLASARDDLGPLARQTAATSDWRLGPTIKPFSASSGALENAVGIGWLAVGDAALSVDPLSSSGLSNALVQGERAAECWLAGRLEVYAENHRRAVATYLAERAAIYGRERRYQAHPFWRRRTSTSLWKAA